MNQFRETIDLNGTWDFCPRYGVHHDLSLPETDAYTTITVPSIFRTEGVGCQDFKPLDLFEYPEEWNQANTAAYRRTFVIPADVLDGNHAILLHSENTAQMAAFYINSEHVTDWDEMFLPLSVDITRYLQSGENRIDVVCTDYDKVKIPSGAEKMTYLSGSFYHVSARGIWGNIFLEVLPIHYLDDVTIRTSVREKTIEVISSLSHPLENAEVSVSIYDGDKAVLTFDGNPGSIIRTWENPIYWDIENPHLYVAKVSLTKGGKTIDEKEVRFGFREIWYEGTQFILNGTPINLRGDSWHFFGTIQMTKEYAHNWYHLCKNNGVNYIRLHAQPHPSYYLDAADEDGMLIVDETAIYGSGKTMDAAHPDYIERCRKHCTRLVRRDRNHPCVVFWSLQNEMRWVDGRDVYKKYIPELMDRIRREDPTRAVSMDGDNRLLPYEQTELESLHYNIDGTLAQWKREKPLTIGEHGGMWYVCPQNASAYVGLSAYDGFEPCAIGFAMKERLFQEDARRKDVSGISTFNFAYYFTRSMPDCDVYVENAPFKKIPKYSLTINNGYLKDYPMYRENPLMPFMREAYRAVTIIGREYNKNFYTSRSLVRHFDVYNDTMSHHDCMVKYTFAVGGKTIVTAEERFSQEPAERHVLTLTLPVPEISEKETAKLTLTLFHEEKEVFSREWNYNLYPETIKSEKIITSPVFFLGEEGFEQVSDLCRNVIRIEHIREAEPKSVLILGSHLSLDFNTIAMELDSFVREGGSLVVLEQSTMGLGNLCLTNRDFFSAHSSHPSHPLLKDLPDEDMIFWGPTVTEDRPEAIIHRNYLKPKSGEYTFVLESDAGDYADGGDLWSPLMTMRYGKGKVVLCQLEIHENYAEVPQACVLLRNILHYAEQSTPADYVFVCACGEKAKAFLPSLGVSYCPDRPVDECDVMLADVADADTDEIKSFLESGKTVVTLPFGETDCAKLTEWTKSPVALIARETSQARCAGNSTVTENISSVDLFRYDKVPMSPRLTQNKRIAHFGICADHAKTLIEDVPNNFWEYKIWGSMRSEPCIIPSVSMSREKKVDPAALLAEQKVGNGTLILSQLSCDGNDEKDVNLYTKILENLGVETKTKLFTYHRTAANDAVDYFMALPVAKWQAADAVHDYFTDPQYSLNNLGEGLYGWMLKVEKETESGFITVPDSRGKAYHLTCFADKEQKEDVKATLESNVPLAFYLNGKRQERETVTLIKGANRICLEVPCQDEADIRFRMILTHLDGSPIADLRTHVTIDEVDPK